MLQIYDKEMRQPNLFADFFQNPLKLPFVPQSQRSHLWRYTPFLSFLLIIRLSAYSITQARFYSPDPFEHLELTGELGLERRLSLLVQHEVSPVILGIALRSRKFSSHSRVRRSNSSKFLSNSFILLLLST